METVGGEGLALQGGKLYGVTGGGGMWGNGTVFVLNTDGSGFTNLHQFSATVDGTNNDGAMPKDALVVSQTCLYGTAARGGSFGSGAVFKISFEPPLGIQVAGTNLVLTWQTNVAGFSFAAYKLQSTARLDSPAWTDVSTDPAIENDQFAISIPMPDAPQFFRLAHQ